MNISDFSKLPSKAKLVDNQASAPFSQTGDQSSRNYKRFRASTSDSSSEVDDITKHDNFFLIRPNLETDSFSTMSPFVIHKNIIEKVPKYKNVSKLRSGDLLIELLDPQHANKLFEINKIGNLECRVTSHPSLNNIKGVISCSDLQYCKDKQEILDECSEQNLIDITQIKREVNGELVPTNTYIITLHSLTLPEYFYVGYRRCKVRQFIPNPKRCFNCQRIGHLYTYCKYEATCPSCGKDKHESDCNPPPYCVNCGDIKVASSIRKKP
ncbi:uncharacterized protein LOC115875269 [Sitophilus oryzae]|uniref:Uncharacterized protein LOC115875269 n=1 Tax=Sitophilus oryzae TaxID=7048 RepID=A0A6J2X6A8_SITOR|nr:uncharacterized protein LOC115875269 [Sitophilus oryzae]